eukprot:235240_1
MNEILLTDYHFDHDTFRKYVGKQVSKNDAVLLAKQIQSKISATAIISQYVHSILPIAHIVLEYAGPDETTARSSIMKQIEIEMATHKSLHQYYNRFDINYDPIPGHSCIMEWTQYIGGAYNFMDVKEEILLGIKETLHITDLQSCAQLQIEKIEKTVESETEHGVFVIVQTSEHYYICEWNIKTGNVIWDKSLIEYEMSELELPNLNDYDTHIF